MLSNILNETHLIDWLNVLDFYMCATMEFMSFPLGHGRVALDPILLFYMMNISNFWRGEKLANIFQVPN